MLAGKLVAVWVGVFVEVLVGVFVGVEVGVCCSGRKPIPSISFADNPQAAPWK